MMRRLLASVVTLLGVIFVLVTLFKFVPGDPARIIAGLQATPAQVEAIRKTMGLEQSVIVQFRDFLEKLLHGNMGVSARTGSSVISEIGQRLPYTLELAVFGTLFGVVFGILLGVLAAKHKGKVTDTIASMVGVMGISMPVYWLGILLILVFSVQLKLLPIGGAASLQSLIMPTITPGVFFDGARVEDDEVHNARQPDTGLCANSAGQWSQREGGRLHTRTA